MRKQVGDAESMVNEERISAPESFEEEL